MEISCFHLLVEMLRTLGWTLIPLLGAVLVCGLITGAMQATTSIHDSSLGTVPRLGVALAVLVFAGPWMAARVMQFTLALMSDFTPFIQ